MPPFSCFSGICRACFALMILIMAQASHAQCAVVATVFGQQICQSDIALPDKQLPGDVTIDPSHRLRLEKMRLARKIRAIAAEHLLARENYTPTQNEVDIFEQFSANAAARKISDDQKLIAIAEHLLKTHEYEARFRQSLQLTITALRRSIELSKQIADDEELRDADMRERFGDEYVTELHRRLEQSKRESSYQWVASWKMNKALYEKYGGRVIFQQAGIEPIDAYRDYLKDIRGEGELKIFKSTYKDVFTEFERYLDMGHNYLNEPGNRYFDRPYWETADLDAEHRKRIEELKSIPHK